MSEWNRMPDLNFEIESVAPRPYAVAPLLNFKLRVGNATGEPVRSVILRCQIMLEVARRRYNDEERDQFLDLFGEPGQWDRTLRNMLWTNASVLVPSFAGATTIDLPVDCTFDFNVAATKYFAGIEEGEAPLLLLFSGTIFYTAETGALQVTQIPWEKEAPTYAVRAIRIDCLVTDLRFGPNRSAMRSSVLPERTLGRTTANESSFSTWK